MSLLYQDKDLTICGPDAKEKEIIPYPFKWREKHCTCVNVIQIYQAWYGASIHHEKACKLLNWPLSNLYQYQDVGVLWQSE